MKNAQPRENKQKRFVSTEDSLVQQLNNLKKSKMMEWVYKGGGASINPDQVKQHKLAGRCENVDDFKA